MTEDGATFKGMHELFSNLTWSPDGKKIGFVERIYNWQAPAASALNGGDEQTIEYRVVAVSTSGTHPFCEISMQRATRQPYSVQWKTANQLQATGDTQGRWLLSVPSLN